MNRSRIIYLFLIFVLFILIGWVGPKIFGSKDVIIVNDISGSKMSVPIDVIGKAEVLGQEMELTITVKVRDFPVPYNETVPNITATIGLPEQLILIDGKPGFIGINITGDEVIERTIKVRAVKNGEGIIEFNATSYGPDIYNTFGEMEQLFVLVIDSEAGKIKISREPFTPPSPPDYIIPAEITNYTPPNETGSYTYKNRSQNTA